ncbi:MAG: endopeptidase La [Proteobacteria bacterium]|jgi:ATP-dependent Lon protease|uniref:Lon protease n=1 Tax=Candidatus Fonsibacter lacus TaxID=2576439 RepID=A0A845S4I2_9PROT|nr:endopeptidase La [Candidatus Fonsibacter lacus]NBP59717.1 endopeptidase La [Pseudomonadota bacterium]NBO62450.1 endopeptidase La [Candidatus Fonsibacter lacus]NBP30985.1 endopeptidase La [Candidatus Fonsibacter lacus]NBP99870.1 endopeptidase La [Pseudomonadota bacterium]
MDVKDSLKINQEQYPVLPLRDIVVFPGMVVPLFVGREKSINALNSVMDKYKKIILAAQKSHDVDDPKDNEIYQVGCLGEILQLLKLPDGTVKILVEGKERVKINQYHNEEKNFLLASCSRLADDVGKEDLSLLSKAVLNKFDKLVKVSKKVSEEGLETIKDTKEPSKVADAVANQLQISLVEKQKILENLSVQNRLESLLTFIESEIEVLSVEKKIRGRVKNQMEKTQREYYLNEQLKAIQKELGETEDGKDEIQNLEEAIKKAKMTKEAEEKSLAELKKLKSMSPMSAESTVVRNYLDWMVSLPWGKTSKVNTDINNAKKILDEDHYGLEKVKDRILEFLAVQSRINKIKGPILCLVGAPGVGKTSLGKSIAKATGREFVRMSLGGIRDEAEIRGHRRTYIGSLPGKIIQMMKKSGKNNPLILLDEIDKIGNDYRGDPSSALLEALDPEQNTTFNDHYLEVDYDLSNVMFVTTANTLNIPGPLLDRMEVIRISGYTEDEKMEIAKKYLLPKQIKENGLKIGEWTVSDEALKDIIRYYTRESGVRSLEREISKLARKGVKDIVTKTKDIIKIDEKNLNDYLGIKKFKYGEIENKDGTGIVTGLAWTEVGGELLTIESVIMPGKGKMEITGKLGEVMQESVKAAKSFVRSRCLEYGIIPPVFEKKDIHIHVPEGATPKDGPSAGIAMVTSIVSSLTGIPVKRDVAMTGEVTLRGRVLPIGGLKEKLLAALRGGIKTVLIPDENEKDLAEIPKNVIEGLKIIPVKTVDEVLKVALTKALSPIDWVEIDLSQTQKGKELTNERPVN